MINDFNAIPCHCARLLNIGLNTEVKMWVKLSRPKKCCLMIIGIVCPNTSDPLQPEPADDTPTSPYRKITTKMTISIIEGMLIFLEAHPQLASKHLKTPTRHTNRH